MNESHTAGQTGLTGRMDFIKPFVCALCDLRKSFKTKGKNKRHLRGLSLHQEGASSSLTEDKPLRHAHGRPLGSEAPGGK